MAPDSFCIFVSWKFTHTNARTHAHTNNNKQNDENRSTKKHRLSRNKTLKLSALK